MFERLEASTVHFAGRVIEVRVDDVRLEDGTAAKREVVIHRGSVAVVAVDRQDRVLLIRQYRHAAGVELWEIPAGRIDGTEEPQAAAVRELAEEAGLRAGAFQLLLDVFITPGYSSERMLIFLARDLTAGQAAPDPDERIKPQWFGLPEALAMCLDGRIRDVKTVAGLFCAVARGYR